MNPQDFWRIYRLLYRRRWLALAVFGSCFGVVLLGCLVMPRYYRASSSVMPSEKALTRPVIPGAGMAPSGNGAGADRRQEDTTFVTMVGLARTGEVLDLAAKSLGLGMTSADLADLVTVEPGQGTMIRITALGRSPRGAIDLANAVAYDFAEYYRGIASEQATRSRGFFAGEVDGARKQRDAAKNALQVYKTSQREAALPPGEKENPFLTQFYSLPRSRKWLSQSCGPLRREWQQCARLWQASRQPSSWRRAPPTILRRNSYRISWQSSRESCSSRRLSSPKSIAKSVISKSRSLTSEKRLSKQVSRMVTHRTIAANPTHEKLAEELVDLVSQQASLRGRVDALRTAMSENEQRAGQLANTSVVLIAKTREYDNAQTRYEQLQALLGQAKVEEQISAETSEIRIVDKARSAVGPVTRSGPSVWQLALLGFVLGLGLAIGTALALEFMDDRVRSREGLWRELDIPVSAVIPQLVEPNGVPLARITELLPLSPYAESYRFLRTEMMHHDGLSRLRTVLVATARPGQGGSTTAANLAISLAEAGKRVVLVDADLRRPVLHHFFETDNDAGLTSLLTNGGGAVANALRRTSMENLLLLPAGPQVPNPAALLTSERMRTVIARLREHSDYVVFDAPSAAAFSDAAVLGAQLDGVIMVVRANQPVREVERQTKRLFAKVGANVVGAVLNGARPQDVDSYYFHQHYYNRHPLPPGPNGGAAASAIALLSPPVAHQLLATEPSTGSTPEVALGVGPGQPTITRRWLSLPIAHRLAIAIISAVLILGLGYLGISSHRTPRRDAAAPERRPACRSTIRRSGDSRRYGQVRDQRPR